MKTTRDHHNSRKTHCINGHEFTPENTYRIATKPNARICRTCTLNHRKKHPRPRTSVRATDTTITVYFISDDLGHIKIGVTKDVNLRRESLQGASPTELRIEATELGGVPRETKLHAQFAEARMYGEWFRFTPEIAMYVNDLITRADTYPTRTGKS